MSERRVSYNKLWKLLIDRNISQTDFRKLTDISFNTMTKLRNREFVSLPILLKLCNHLDCDISDICEFVRDES
ncbi:MAG: helix-turn-helix transcriptional regulator [Oscillospiraceae bacterium]|jgi:DNA-binding Xre family transcriptional regulator|nr:helix-turn-helix transcriptional regulator [Oscillospiraceae bacterium]